MILSSDANLKYFKKQLTEQEIVDVLSDLKHRVFPRPFERLSPLCDKKGLVGAEIGVCGGEHALSLLKTLDIKTLYLIDPYTMRPDYEDGKLHYGIDQATLDEAEKSAKELLKDYEDKIVWIKKTSSYAFYDLYNTSVKLDFVYIDGDHAYDSVYDDLDNYIDLLTEQDIGVIGGHDFYNGFQKEHNGVIDAVTDWVIANPHCVGLKVELPDWWFVVV